MPKRVFREYTFPGGEKVTVEAAEGDIHNRPNGVVTFLTEETPDVDAFTSVSDKWLYFRQWFTEEQE